MNIDLILWIAAVMCWLIATFGIKADRLVPLGLALAGLTFVI